MKIPFKPQRVLANILYFYTTYKCNELYYVVLSQEINLKAAQFVHWFSVCYN